MTQTIITLEPTEHVTFDHAVLADLCAAEGHHAEAAITDALSRVEALIAMIPNQADHIAGLSRTCAELQRVSGRIGMTTVRDAASAVLECISRHDATSMAACAARLVRLGEPKQTNGWTMQPETVA